MSKAYSDHARGGKPALLDTEVAAKNPYLQGLEDTEGVLLGGKMVV